MNNNLIKIADIPNYVYKLTGKRPTRQTVYRWIRVGKQDWRVGTHESFIKLETKTVLWQLYSTEKLIDTFLERLI